MSLDARNGTSSLKQEFARLNESMTLETLMAEFSPNQKKLLFENGWVVVPQIVAAEIV